MKKWTGGYKHEFECVDCGIRFSGVEKCDGTIVADDKLPNSGRTFATVRCQQCDGQGKE